MLLWYFLMYIQISSWNENIRFICNTIIATSIVRKAAFVAYARWREQFRAEAMAHLMLEHGLYFLKRVDTWVDALLDAEGRYGWNCLTYLLRSQHLCNSDFRCRHFRELLELQQHEFDINSTTALMYLCECNPQLLCQNWVVSLI